MKKNFFVMILVFVLTIFASGDEGREQCTSAVVTAEASACGAPLLWKNRDTADLSNKVIFVSDTPYSYLGLANAECNSGRKCFAGLNSTGFAIINTVAANLPKNSGEAEDLEGVIIADALRTCRSIGDFEHYIQANLGRDLGALSNFCVIDSGGGAAIFELHNHGYKRLDAGQAPEKYLVNTNFARSGREGKGGGYLRFERASTLFRLFPPFAVDYRRILHEFTRDLGHMLLVHPAPNDLKSIPAEKDYWLFTRDCINRPSTASAVVIIGKKASDPRAPAVLWVIPGEPVCALAVPVFVDAGCSPEPLWQGADAPLWKESLRIKSIIRPLHEENKGDYLNAVRLDNAAGTGFLPLLLKTEEEIIRQTEEFLKKKHKPAELASFQGQMAEKALAVMQSTR